MFWTARVFMGISHVLMNGDVPALYRDLRPVIRLSASNGLS
ncbi:MAG: hypothetical protein OJF50_004592 [Nitrospira sp.]|nr:hypothetical protein [Nitrospira sp.]